MTTHQPEAAFFTAPQTDAILVWDAAQPQGFGARIMIDHEDHPELAELHKHDGMSPPWFLHTTQDGAAAIAKVAGTERELGTIEETLTQVLELGRVTSDVAWSVRIRMQQSRRSSSH